MKLITIGIPSFNRPEAAKDTFATIDTKGGILES